MIKFYKIAFLCFLLASCNKPITSRETSTLTFENDKKITSFNVEIAKTSEQMRDGLMNREKLGQKNGMYFVIKPERPVVMWMKDTKFALDMIFIDAQSKISGIVSNAVPMSETLIPSPNKVSAVVELNAGSAKKYNLKVGDIATLTPTK